MFEDIRADLAQDFHRRKFSNLNDTLYFLLFESHGPQAVIVYRFGRWLEKLSKHHYGRPIIFLLYPAYKLLSVFMQKAYGINLDQSADIAPGFCITHFGGIDVRNCCIGLRCNIHQQVKLGSTKATVRGLVIGDGVYIGAHTQIHSNISIGNGVTIGAGAVVTQDIPHHCLVLGNPGRIIQRDYDNSSLL